MIRHGETALNRSGILQGRSDHPLNEKGIRQAREAGLRLSELGVRFDRVFTSPLRRAVQTAELAAPGVSLVRDQRLIEMDYGPYEGTDLNAPPPEVTAFFRDFSHTPAPDGMEPLSDIVERTGAFLEEIRGLSGNILISAHAISMKGMLEYLTPSSCGSYWSKYIGNCTVYRAENEDGVYGIPEAYLT